MELNSLTHIRWDLRSELSTRYGRVAVKVEDLRVQIRSISGPDMPANLLFPVLNAALPEGWIEAAEQAHASRANPWCVNVYRGMSGCENHELYSLQDKDFMDQKQVCAVHVSMYGKLNAGFNCWLGDIPPLLASLIESYPPPPASDFGLRTYDPELRGDYVEAGESSGLRETLKDLQAMEVLAK